MRQRWVVISNCQSFGLSASINALAKTVDCTPCDHFEFSRRIAEDPDHFRGYDFAVVAPDLAARAEGKPFTLPAAVEVPGFHFEAYQPDCAYVFADGAALHGHVGPYHSLIALAAYKEGVPAADVAGLFNPHIFEAGGYLDSWLPWRERIAGLFRKYDLDIAASFVRRSRGRCFMHTIDHPKIEILFDIARALLTRLGQETFVDAVLPQDALTGTSWPIYPEVGEQLGVRGAYLFRAPQDPKPIGLQAFLDESRALYAQWDRSLLRVPRPAQPRLWRIRDAIRAAS